MKYRPEIDGLRALAVLPVMLFHAGLETFSGGFIGVDVFFVISGYLITTIILKELKQEKFSIVNFYERRARRIFPALFLVMFFCIPFAWFLLLPSDMIDFSKSLVAVSLFASNILFSYEHGYFDAAAELKPLLHTWSLAVEEQYYVLFPIFLILFWKLGQRWILFALGIVFFLSIAVAQQTTYTKSAAAFFLLTTRGWELMIGAFIAFYLLKANRKKFSKEMCELSGWLGVALIIYAVITYNKLTTLSGLYALIPILGAVLIILFATQQTTVGKFIGNPIFVGVGLISYSLYLWHYPLFAFARHYGFSHSDSNIFLVLSIVSVMLAYLSWRFVEVPLRGRGNFTRGYIFGLSFILLFFFISLGLLGKAKNGNLWRYSDDIMNYFKLKNSSDEFVWDLKNKLRGKDFNSGKTKILVVGDSNSGDLLNILSAIDRDNVFSLSSLTIKSGCGNLYLPRNNFSYYIKFDEVKWCADIDDLLADKNMSLIKQADWVIFASGWTEWEADLFFESYNKLVSAYGDKFWFFGNKHLDFSYIKFIRSYKNSLFPSTAYLEVDKLKINARLKEVAGDRFIDPYELFCVKDKCSIRAQSGELLLYDGFHLTREGVNFFAAKLDVLAQQLKNKH
jgi:peptidoglycan/LPS O-acetylase OafA/YrhL